jgi:regulator of cell morphogenesis and NO signaling
MTTFDANMAVGLLVAERPARARVFDRLGIDYCCGGREPLARACEAKGLDVQSVLRGLDACDDQARSAGTDEWFPASMADLVDFIVATHHAYLRHELPRLSALAAKVAGAHGARHPELREVRRVLAELRDELEAHMDEEELIVFPRIKRLQAERGRGPLAPGAVSGLIRAMEREHEDAGSALARLRALTDGYAPPPDACDAYRALLGGLAGLEADMHAHVHRENNILFPAAIAAECAPSAPRRPQPASRRGRAGIEQDVVAGPILSGIDDARRDVIARLLRTTSPCRPDGLDSPVRRP